MNLSKDYKPQRGDRWIKRRGEAMGVVLILAASRRVKIARCVAEHGDAMDLTLVDCYDLKPSIFRKWLERDGDGAELVRNENLRIHYINFHPDDRAELEGA